MVPIYLFDQPRAVFIHIPKTAGTSIRAKWPAPAVIQAFGHLPAGCGDAPRFAVVRHPEDRFLSAVHMFRHGAEGVSDYYATPRWPELTMDGALDLLEDDEVPFDRSQRTLPANLKHHLLPQTHPFNALHHADILLRQETLAQDFAALAARLGLDPDLPRLRSANPATRAALAAELTGAQRARLRRLYAGDFTALGYGWEPGRLTGPAQVPPAPPPAVWDVWTAYFSNRVPGSGTEALPAPDCDLALFRDTPLPGTPGPTWAGRERNLNAHFHALQPEFAGGSRLSHLLGCVIVVLRRTPADPAARRLFARILSEQGPVVAGELNLRWLTAVCDTAMDVAEDPQDRALGLAGSLLANTVKLYETELRLFHPRPPAPPRPRFRKGGALFDGVITFWPERGDMIANLVTRAEAVLSGGAALAPFVREIVDRVLLHDTAFRRFAEGAGVPGGTVSRKDRRRIETLLGRLGSSQGQDGEA